ncbi:MAG: helicase-exonuclease AddAB subunit AddA [Lachnospiraceae bacterium]|nr:helicase-exonuclease AddAB subunit AddA [Lachnospiraceae bacterium]
MAISFTPEQQEVIDLHNCNILVSAAAGSGKTAVLVERIVQMVCDGSHPVDIDRLLIVTFTNAAAAEMRERISAGIAEKLLENPEDEHIQKQATLLHNAQITTIDSFSLFLIRNHFNEIGLDPAFRVADEGEIKLLSRDVLQELLEEKYAAKDADFTYCVEYFCPGGREKVLEDHILNLSRYAASFPWPEEWLMQRKADYAAITVSDLMESDYGKYLCAYMGKVLAGCYEKLKEVQLLCESPDGPYMYGELVDNELEQIEKVCGCKNLEDFAARIPAISFGRLPSKKDASVSPEKRELAKELRSQVKETLQKLSESFFLTPLSLAVEQGRECAAPVGTLIDLVLEFDRRMKAKKQERKLIDFSDMEHYALDILLDREVCDDQECDGKKSGQKFLIRPSHVALEYRQYFHEILIDEYQDSNLVQEYLLKAVSGEEEGNFNRFMVGDVKQSIYKFRLARPELFLEKYETYSDSGACRRIDLSRNFRSRTQVVDTVNDVFSRIMSKTIGGIEYDDKAALYAGASYPENADCSSELLLVEKPAKEDELGAKEAEALAIAGRIKELKQHFQVTDKATGELRPVRFSDMVILLRSNSGWDEEFKKVLEEEGIPVYITSKTGYFAATEVQELLQLLRVLDNPLQDIPLYGVMKSLFGGFTEEEIACIRGFQKGGSLYEAVCAYAQENDSIVEVAQNEGKTCKTVQFEECKKTELQEKMQKFIQIIKSYRDCTTYMPIRDLLQKLVTDFDYLNYVTALPAGSKRRANVEMLFTKASDFEKTSYFGLFHFIRYMEQLEKYDVDYGEADTLDENADVVRIMSIHKSKGLEFPVTFVSGTAKRFNMQDTNQALIVDMDLGLATDYVNPVKRIRNKTLRRMALSRKMREDNLAEELRVLYVALTRAKEKLIMTGTLEKATEKWELQQMTAKEQLSYLDFVEAGSYLDFLLPILGQSRVKVAIADAEVLLGNRMKEQFQFMDRRLLLGEAEKYADAEALQKLRKQFAYQYPYEKLQKLYTKTTVSELKIAAMAEKDEAAYHAFEEKEVQPYIPAFKRGEEAVSGTVRGNAFHRVMELMDFEELLGGLFAEFPEDYENYRRVMLDNLGGGKQGAEFLNEALQNFLKQETKSLRLSEEYVKAINIRKLVHFLESELAYRMWSADRRGELYREQPFVLGIDAGRLGEEFPADETVLIQGIIDVFFVEDGELVLLDYKTDVIGSMEELWNRYSVQLDYYEEALSRLMSMPVKEKVLYSFYLEETGSRG